MTMLQRSHDNQGSCFRWNPSRRRVARAPKVLGAKERETTAQLIACLAEVDASRLHLGEGCSSLFTYCTQVLHLSDHAAYLRIEAARAARKFPVILNALAEGALHLTAVSLVAPHLTPENLDSVLVAARHKTKREVEELVASLRPQPPVVSSVRKLPARPTARSSPDATAPPIAESTCVDEPVRVPAPTPAPRVRHDEVKPLAPEHYKVQFTVSRETHDKLREAQQLLRHQIHNGDVGSIFERALTLLVSELRKARHAAVVHPRPSRPAQAQSRHIPATVKREVWARDGGQCAFVGAVGRCTERGFLEYHHVVPFADGGETTPANLELRCRAHNAYEAERWFGEVDLLREVAPIYGSVIAGERKALENRPNDQSVALTCGIFSSSADGLAR